MVNTPEKSQSGADSMSIAAALSDVLLEGLQLMASAGHADAACRLAGRACAALRHDHPAQWRRFNVLLHRLSPATGKIAASEVLAHGCEHETAIDHEPSLNFLWGFEPEKW